MKYSEFLKTKLEYGKCKGMNKVKMPNTLFDFQKAIVKWACNKGRAAIFADTGLGKTFMQLSWAENAIKNIPNDKKVIVFAPLLVNDQTIQEGKKIPVDLSRWNIQDNERIKIANYEQIDNLNPDDYGAIVLDESSILKSIDSKTREKLIEFSKNITFRSAYTATPAPNDVTEYGNHAEFLGVMKREEMLARFFINKADTGEGWMLKGHAVDAFYKWLATWAVFIKYPSDIGFSDDGYKLPKINFIGKFFDYEFVQEGTLFSTGFHGIEDRVKIRKDTIEVKAGKLAEEVNGNKEQHIIWCGLNPEAEAINKLIPDSENLQGSDSDEEKIRKVQEFKKGKIRVLITKAKMGKFGLNLQNCHNVHFLGMSDSYEEYYQCIRRCHRFGQKKQVNVYMWLAGDEKEILNNVIHKEEVAQKTQQEVIKHIKIYENEEIKGMKHEKQDYKTDELKTENYHIYMGDSCEVMKKINDNSIDLSVFSPPFSSLYTYSPSDRDLGNCQNDDEFFIHFEYIVKELNRIIKPGRICAVHCMDLPTKKITHGYIGLIDFGGMLIKLFEKNGFVFHSKATIKKNPQAAAIRTHAKGLMFKQVHKDSTDSRMGIPDYVIMFKKNGENEIPVIPNITNEDWIKYANPIWDDIRETYTLNSRESKSEKDEKHICPLQLDVIERVVKLYSNKGDTVFSPFMGIGSEGVKSIEHGRKFKGIELKPEYYLTAVKNLKRQEQKESGLFGVENDNI